MKRLVTIQPAQTARRCIRPLRDGLLVGVILLIPAFASLAVLYSRAYSSYVAEVRRNLMDLAQAAAAVVDGDLHRTFTSPEQEQGEDYQRAVEPLRRIMKSSKAIRYLYTAILRDGEVHFILDATPWGDADHDGVEDHSPIMQLYDLPDPAMLEALEQGRTTVSDQPTEDQWGPTMSGNAPFFDSQGRQAGIVGVDVTLATYTAELASIRWAALWGLLPAVAGSGLAGLGTVVLRRKAAREADERQCAEQALWLTQLAVDRASDAVFWTDAEGRFTYVNQAACARLGYSREELLKRRVWEVDAGVPAENWGRHWQELKSRGALQFESHHRTREGRLVPIDLRANFVEFNGGEYNFAFARDITDRKHAENELQAKASALRIANLELEAQKHQLRAQQEELENINRELQRALASVEAANSAKSAFLANMSHEIRTPMSAILGYAELLGDHELAEAERREYVGIIQRNGEHLLALINDILDLSKIEAGKMNLELTETRLIDVVNDVLRVLRPRAAEKGLTLEPEYVFPLPEILRTDPVRLHEILVNLVGNAIKFTERGGIRVRVSVREREHGRPLLCFEVSDTGVGMTTEQMRLLFRPFTQVDNSTKRRYAGTGLGLAISKRLAELLGGTIECRSTAGVGSTFQFTIDPGPLDRSRMLLEPEALSAAAAPRYSARATPLLHGRVLLAEDGPDNQRLITTILRKAGLQVDVASNGRLALEQATAAQTAGKPYDLILMDMQMPEMDGYEATRAIRATGYTGPIVALTAHAMAHDRENCLAAGCSDYASKPINRAVLIKTVRRHLRTGALAASDT